MTLAADTACNKREPARIAWWGLGLLVVLIVHAGLALLLLSRQIALTPAPPPPVVLIDWLSRHKRYPRAAREQQQQGTAYLRFVVDRYGRVLSYGLARSSGIAALEEEVVALIQRAQPLPAPPAELSGARFELVAPVEFSLRGYR